MVFLPGLICNDVIFNGQKPVFNTGVFVRGYGDCATLGEMADTVIKQAPKRFDLFGHSMGGRVALEVFRKVPDRINSLILASTGIHGRRRGEREKRYKLRDLGRTQGFEALVESWLMPMIAPHNCKDTGLVKRLKQMCLSMGQSTFENQIEALLGRPEVETLLPEIRVPTLVITGELDQWSPPEQHRQIASLIPGSLCSIIKGSGHMLPAEASDQLNTVICEWRNEYQTYQPKQKEAGYV